MHRLIFALAVLVVVAMTVPERVAALTVEIWSREPPPATGGTKIGASLTTTSNDPENGNKKTLFLSTPPTLPSDCAGTPRDFSVSGVTFRFADVIRAPADATCPNGRIFIDSTTNLKARARVFVDNSNASAPKVVFAGKITATFTGTTATATVRVTVSSPGDFASNTASLTYGAASKGTYRRIGPTTIVVPTNNTVKVNTRVNPATTSPNVVNTPGTTAPANSLSTADPPSASIPPSTFQAGASCTTVGITKSCSASFDIADTESNIACSGSGCPSLTTDWTYGFARSGDIMEKTGSGVTAFSASLGEVLAALDQCNVWASNPAALGIRVQFLQPAPGNNFSSGETQLAGKATAFLTGGDFFLASPISSFYVALPGALVNDEESVVSVVPGLQSVNDDGQKICEPATLSDLTSLKATSAFKNGTDCRFSSYRFEIFFDGGQIARGMFGQKSGQYFRQCASTNQNNVNFVTSTVRNWQLDDGPFIAFATLRDALPSTRITSLRLVLDQGLNPDADAGVQLVDLDEVSFTVGTLVPQTVRFAPPPAGVETEIQNLPRAAALARNLTTGATFVIPEADVNITNSQWVFHAPVGSLPGNGAYDMRMCLAQVCPNDAVNFSVFLPSQ